jgi:hypothetical protein
MGNWELDVVVEDERFGRAMEAMYIDDLGNATEILVERRRRVRPANAARHPRKRGSGGSATRAAAGALRIGNAIGSALVARQVTGPAERQLFVQGGSCRHDRRLLLAAAAGLAGRRAQPLAGCLAPPARGAPAAARTRPRPIAPGRADAGRDALDGLRLTARR